MQNLTQADALVLNGTPHERGKAQAQYAKRENVVSAIDLRIGQNKAILANPKVRDYLDQQWEFASRESGDELAEMKGVAEAFGLDSRDLFAFLHLGIVSDMDTSVTDKDGCSSWAVSTVNEGPLVGKNRDFSGEHAVLQAVFLHRDPSWKSGHQILCVGSLGCPGAYSSGINSDGLAIVDTHIPTRDTGVGWQRYFLMTHLLTRHSDVASALAFIKSVPHAGGGSLILSDPSGRVAAVDLGHSLVSVTEQNSGWVARTNHFAPGSVANYTGGIPLHASTLGRRETLINALSKETKTFSSLTRLIKSHSSEDTQGLCRHNEDGDGSTLSGAIFVCQSRTLYFSNGKPCCTDWQEFSIS